MKLEAILNKKMGISHIGGILYLCEKNFTPQSKISNKDKCFSLRGLTTFTCNCLMCCVIFKGKNVALRRKIK